MQLNHRDTDKSIELLNLKLKKYEIKVVPSIEYSEDNETKLLVDLKIDEEKNKIYIRKEDILLATIYDIRYVTLIRSLRDKDYLTELKGDMLYIFMPENWIKVKDDFTIELDGRLSKFKGRKDNLLKNKYFTYICLSHIKENNYYLLLSDKDALVVTFENNKNIVYADKSISMDLSRKNKFNNIIILQIYNENFYVKCIEKKEKMHSDEKNISALLHSDMQKEVEQEENEEGIAKMIKEFQSQEDNKFMQLWNEFSKTEEDILKKLQLQAGELKYKNFQNFKFIIENFENENYDAWKSLNGYGVCLVDKSKPANVGETPVGVISEVGYNFVKIEIESDLVANKISQTGGSIKVSFRADEVRMDRRKKAFNKVKSKNSSIKELGKILYGEYDYTTVVHNYIFKDLINGRIPNEMQMEAIAGSINTDNIFLIQGPPGTGKTTIIKKLVSILKENNKQILITSFQNIAVDNVLSGLSDYGLLAYRYNEKDNSGAFIYKEFAEKILCNLESKIKNNPRARKQLLIDEIKVLKNRIQIKEMFFKVELIDILEKIKLKYEQIVDFKDKNIMLIEQIIESQTKEEKFDTSYSNIDTSKVQKEASKLPGCFDQLMENIDALYNFKNEIQKVMLVSKNKTIDKLYKEYVDMIQDERIYDSQENENYFTHLKKCADNILKEIEKNSSTTDEISKDIIEEVLNLCDAIVEDTPNVNNEFSILTSWKYELENNPYKLDEVFKKYSDVYGTTCQKVGSFGFNSINNLPEYDYVIVDEAARANALDLLIPLVNGKKIILVGDHKQLPHLIENEMDEELKKNSNITKENYEKYIKESLFGRLYDEIPKDRKVMLDTQFRMNKEIGAVVSELFYENNLKTGTNIVNDTPMYTGKSLVAVDVKGMERYSLNRKGAIYNKDEARVILEKLKVLDKEGNFDVGIITFYKEQAEHIKREIRKIGLVNIKPEVNTVDAFQGKENEIIFLSTVRTDGIGFTANPNRLNVALSRAKKLVVIVSHIENMKSNNMYKQLFERCHIER